MLCAAGRLREAVELFYHITHEFDDDTNTELVDWLMGMSRPALCPRRDHLEGISTPGFRVCVAALVMEADAALRIESLMAVFQRRESKYA